MDNNDKIPTSDGDKSIPEIMDMLMYGSYKANRDLNCSHDLLVKNGIGNEAMKKKYEQDKATSIIQSAFKGDTAMEMKQRVLDAGITKLNKGESLQDAIDFLDGKIQQRKGTPR